MRKNRGLPSLACHHWSTNETTTGQGPWKKKKYAAMGYNRETEDAQVVCAVMRCW
ncbi:hypothetical protein ACB092_05G012000 [Castanea dentata]